MNGKATLRCERILRELQHSGSVTVEQFCALLGVSLATVRRDVQELAA
jgi:DeoR/GlpR family transcriptional regulator of sugar metabolism